MSRRGVSPPGSAQSVRVAFMRFGLGPKPGWPVRIGTAPDALRTACLRELNNPGAALLNDPGLRTLEECGLIGLGPNMPGNRPVDGLFTQERVARFAKYTEPEIGFVERLVMFWTNHFSLFPASDFVRATMGHVEREVIRKHVLGKYSDMLKGVISHPAMIRRLENQNSIGPTSAEGRRTRRGLNENLARETLELYTVGVNGGYTQADVTNLAMILTGWTFRRASEPKPGTFFFNASGHEPGAFTVMGRSFGEPGQAKGLAALDMLAAHPRTAEHIAYKLILHFITDTPSPRSVATLALVYRRTGGDLKAVAQELLNLPEAWNEPLNRLRQPQEWMISMARAVGFDKSKAESLHRRFNNWGWLPALNHSYWHCPTPNGYPDLNSFWLTPNAMRLRRDAAFAFCQQLLQVDEPWNNPSNYWRVNRPELTKPAQFAQGLLPGSLSPATLLELEAPNSRDDNQVLPHLALLFVTPEFLNK